jgi:glycosyltransferase involved in cell wall biosynthesis
MIERLNQMRNTPRTLAGATILQIVPALRESTSARTALNVAHTLLQAGARALVAGDDGPLVEELKGFGGEWIALATDSINPLTRSRSVRVLENLVGSERVDIVHAHSPGGTASARKAASKIAVWLVTTLADTPPVSSRDFRQAATLARGDRVIAPSVHAATPVIERYGIAREQITIIPRSIDMAQYDRRNVPSERIDALRKTWGITPGDRVVFTPGRVAPWNGQVLVPDMARTLVESGHRNTVFLIVGENRTNRRYARSVLERARDQGVAAQFRITGHCPDLPAAFAIADVVVIPALEPPALGRAVAQAQAMGRPVVTSDVGNLPEQVVVPPYLPEDVRTGWVVAAGDPNDFARALDLALSLDDTAYHAMSLRARQFAEYMFSPESVAEATRAVYTSLLARDR